MASLSGHTTQSNVLHSSTRIFLKQIKFPPLLRGVTESLIFCGVFLAAGHVSLGLSVVGMLAPMVPVVFLMMCAMVLSGVYRPEITNSIMNLYIRSIYGFVLGAVMVITYVHFFVEQFATVKFEFFFLFFAFFVMNTMRPIISGTDFMDGGGRRTN